MVTEPVMPEMPVTPEGLEAAAKRYMEEVKDICDAKARAMDPHGKIAQYLQIEGQGPSLEEMITTGHPRMELIVNHSFEAAHRLPKHPGKCQRVHGHSYRVRVVVKGLVDSDSGMIIDFHEVKEVIDQLDHQYLNDFIKNPTAEHIALWLLGRIPGAVEVHLWEGLGGCSVVARI